MKNLRHSNDDQAFEEFRRAQEAAEKKPPVQPDEGEPRQLANQTLRSIQEREEREAREKHPIEDIRDMTREAAGMLFDLDEEQSEELSQKISGDPGGLFPSAIESGAHLCARPAQNEQPVETTPEPLPEDPRTEDDLLAEIAEEIAYVHPLEPTNSAKPSFDLVDPVEFDVEGVTDSIEQERESKTPAIYARLLADSATAKRTLDLLVDGGVLTTEEGRAVYLEAMRNRSQS